MCGYGWSEREREKGGGWTPRGPPLDATLDRSARGWISSSRAGEKHQGGAFLTSLGLFAFPRRRTRGSTGICRAGAGLRVSADDVWAWQGDANGTGTRLSYCGFVREGGDKGQKVKGKTRCTSKLLA